MEHYYATYLLELKVDLTEPNSSGETISSSNLLSSLFNAFLLVTPSARSVLANSFISSKKQPLG